MYVSTMYMIYHVSTYLYYNVCMMYYACSHEVRMMHVYVYDEWMDDWTDGRQDGRD